MGVNDTAVIGIIFLQIVVSILIIYHFKIRHQMHPVKHTRRKAHNSGRVHTSLRHNPVDERYIHMMQDSYPGRKHSFVTLGGNTGTGEFIVPKAMSTLIDKIMKEDK